MKRKREPFLDAPLIARYVNATAERFGFRARFDPDTPTAYTTIDGEVVLPAIKSNATDDDLDHLRWYVVHEGAHWTYGPEAFKLMEKNKIKGGTKLGYIYNVVEDAYIEHAAARRWPGDAAILSAGWDAHLRGLEAEGPPADRFAKDPDAAKLAACWIAGSSSRASWIPTVEAGLRGLITKSQKDLEPHLDILVRELNVPKRLTQPIPPQARLDLAREIFTRLFPGEPESAKLPGATEIVVGRLLQDNHKSTGAARKGAAEAVRGKPKKGKGGKNDEPWDYDADDIRWVSYNAGWENHKTRGQGGIPTIPHHLFKAGAKLRAALQTKAAVRYAGAQTKGRRLNVQTMHRAVLPREIGTFRERLWRTKTTSDVLDTAISLNIDASSSMDWSDMQTAASVARLFVHICQDVLQIPTEVTAYTSGGYSHHSGTILGLCKRFDERLPGDELHTRIMAFHSAYAMGTPSVPNMLETTARLRTFPAKRHIFFHLTDGDPNGTHNAREALADLVDKLDSEGVVEPVGVAIGSVYQRLRDIFGEARTLHVERIESLGNELFTCLYKLLISNQRNRSGLGGH